MSIHKDKEDFVSREKKRRNALLEDKLQSMKKIVEYERELNNFEAGHQKLNSEIRMGKASNQLIQACITGLFNDQQYMQQLQDEATQVEE